MHWGHARTKDFLTWEELEVALAPDRPYDADGCWSGTAIVKDDVLYLFYASVRRCEETGRQIQTVSVAYSEDGIHFQKYAGNPVIDRYPTDGGPDFRDPAVTCIDGVFYLVMATGNPPTKTGRLLLYRSEDLFRWQYDGILSEWADCRFTECPSLVETKDGCLLAASVCPLEKPHYFSLMLGDFKNGKFLPRSSAELDRGPDQYAGQVFRDNAGRVLMISWMPGWAYKGYAARDFGCMSAPRRIFTEGGRLRAFPPEELTHLLKSEDDALTRTEDGFVILREDREPVVYHGKIETLHILRDGPFIEVFVNGGEEVFTALL